MAVPPVVKYLLIANGLVFLMELYIGDLLITKYALWPLDLSNLVAIDIARPHFQLPQLITYAFLHGGMFHLLLNMYALWMFGSRIEALWGSKVFLIYYIVCVIGAGLVQLIVSAQSDVHYPTIGASGGVFGVLLAFGLFFPHERLLLIFPPIPIQARNFVILFGLIELWYGITGTAQGIAHFAHLGGMLFGYILIWYWRRHPPN